MKNNRKSFVSGFAAFLLLLAGTAPSFSQEKLSGNLKEQLNTIQTLIDQKGGKWVAGETSLSNLSMDEWMMRVGLNFKSLNAPPLPALDESKVPASLDWRDNNGNYVTPIRNQKKCGSCWAFSLTGGLESYVLVTQNQPGKNLDLSEQIMVSCSGVGSCNGGTLDADYLQSTGLPLETVYPYTATDGTCSSAAPGWESATYKIGAWGSVAKKLATVKAALVKYGPLPTAFMVYEDFMHYKSGIYSYTTGKKLGGHAVLLVGYNDAEQYFIVKNSWDTGWGENGFFKIAYSEMNTVVNFGLSTIAYQTKSAKDPAASFSEDTAWKRAAPLFAPLLQWQQ
ncbi:MAG: C1 family peptidase [Elusimicrobia bacterium]|nr:C1 family peptidase [Elusimicrobiota bacterium]